MLHVLRCMHRGGVEVRLLELVGRLHPQEFVVDICAHSGLAGPLDDDVRACGGTVIPLRLDAWFPARFIRLLRQGRYHVVHSHVLHASGAILALAARAGTPVRIAHFHVTHDGRRGTLRRRVQRTVMRHLIDRYATDIVGCSEGVMDEAWNSSWRADPRCRAIYYGTDAAGFEERGDHLLVRARLQVPDGARVYLHLGRVAADGQKNHGRLLAIFAEILKTAPESRLVLAGIGTDSPDGEIARGVRDLGIQHRVIGLGMRDDVPRLLAAADVLLLPSLWEGLPNVVLEACAAGVPVLASDLSGVREIASRLSLVRYLPLTASDAEWAMVASGLPAEAEQLRLRDTAADAFRGSVFHVDRFVEAHRALWQHAAGRSLACF